MVRSGPLAVEIAAGETLHRVHAVANAARFYGRRDGTWRWDDLAHGYGVMYLGRTRVGPFAETMLRRPNQRILTWSEVEKRRFAALRTIAQLRLADLHGSGLGWFGVTVTEPPRIIMAPPIRELMPTARRSRRWCTRPPLR